MEKAKSLKDIKQINRNKILQQVYFNGPLSRLQICNHTGLSPATVGNLMVGLMDEGIVQEIGFEESQGGRRRVILQTNKKLGFIIGIDIGRSYIQIEAFDFHMEVLGSRKSLLDFEYELTDLTEIIINEINQLLTDQNLINERLLGIGIALPGLVNIEDNEIGWYLKEKSVIPGLKNSLETSFKTTVTFDNGSKAMALAELWYGAGKGYSNIISTILGRGVGSGIIVDGKIIRGHSNFSGEWGHSVMGKSSDGDGFTYKSIEDMIGDVINNFWIQKGNGENINSIGPVSEVNAIKALAESGDSDALKVIDQLSEIIGVGLSSFINLFNPELIILGGWLGVSLVDKLLPKLRPYLNEFTISPNSSDIVIEPSHFGEGESCIGAASLVINSYLGYNI